MFIKTNLIRYMTFNFASAITLFPFVLVDKRTRITRRLVQHEKIHLRQQVELLVIPFYVLYVFEFLIHLTKHRSIYIAYMNISFEKECYQNEGVKAYLQHRKPFGWLRYMMGG